MWQTLGKFFGSQVARIGGLVIKAWHVTLLATVVIAGTASGIVVYNRLNNVPSPQHVIVYVAGLNTSMSNCLEETFFETLRTPLEQQVGIQNPYTKGCNGFGRNYLSSSTSSVLYSYTGGQMDAAHGVYIPNDYNACNVNNLTLQSDVQGFDHMLDQYRRVYPQATFSIIGHSLGGLVALQGAYDYAITLGHANVIDNVITLDAPLKGVQTKAAGTFLSDLGTIASKFACVGPTGSVVSDDIVSLGDASSIISPEPLDARCAADPYSTKPIVLSACAALALGHAGVGVITVGNEQDTLYCAARYAAFRVTTCGTQDLSHDVPILGRLENLAPLPGDDPLFPGHGAVLLDPKANQRIIQNILAPVVTITQPKFDDIIEISGGDAVVSYSATVHCLWGAPRHAQAKIVSPTDGSVTTLGSMTSTSADNSMVVSGTATLSAAKYGIRRVFFVDVSG